MCLCRDNNFARVPTEENGVIYPMSEHSPMCDEFKQEPFTRLEYDGVSCIMEPREAEALLADDGEDGYAISVGMLARDQFEKLRDFDGF